MMRKAIGAALVALLSTGGVQADGLERPVPGAPLPGICASCWSGLYAGASAGLAAGRTEEMHYNGTLAWPSEQFEIDGGFYGAHLGYNIQRGSVVLGIEAGWNGADTGGGYQGDFGSGYVEDGAWIHESYTYKRKLSSFGSVTGRIGYAPGKILYYGFGGVAWGDVKTHFKATALVEPSQGAPFTVSYDERSSDTHTGWTAGAGIEFAVNGRVRLRTEYAHMDFGSETLFRHGSYYEKADIAVDAVKIGASYKLTDGDGSLEAPLK